MNKQDTGRGPGTGREETGRHDHAARLQEVREALARHCAEDRKDTRSWLEGLEEKTKDWVTLAIGGLDPEKLPDNIVLGRPAAVPLGTGWGVRIEVAVVGEATPKQVKDLDKAVKQTWHPGGGENDLCQMASGVLHFSEEQWEKGQKTWGSREHRVSTDGEILRGAPPMVRIGRVLVHSAEGMEAQREYIREETERLDGMLKAAGPNAIRGEETGLERAVRIAAGMQLGDLLKGMPGRRAGSMQAREAAEDLLMDAGVEITGRSGMGGDGGRGDAAAELEIRDRALDSQLAAAAAGQVWGQPGKEVTPAIQMAAACACLEGILERHEGQAKALDWTPEHDRETEDQAVLQQARRMGEIQGAWERGIDRIAAEKAMQGVVGAGGDESAVEALAEYLKKDTKEMVEPGGMEIRARFRRLFSEAQGPLEKAWAPVTKMLERLRVRSWDAVPEAEKIRNEARARGEGRGSDYAWKVMPEWWATRDQRREALGATKVMAGLRAETGMPVGSTPTAASLAAAKLGAVPAPGAKSVERGNER